MGFFIDTGRNNDMGRNSYFIGKQLSYPKMQQSNITGPLVVNQ